MVGSSHILSTSRNILRVLLNNLRIQRAITAARQLILVEGKVYSGVVSRIPYSRVLYTAPSG